MNNRNHDEHQSDGERESGVVHEEDEDRVEGKRVFAVDETEMQEGGETQTGDEDERVQVPARMLISTMNRGIFRSLDWLFI